MKKVLIIYGPTSTGKTALAIKLAKKYSGEIISADSRQVYLGLDIGTGKLSLEKLKDQKIKRSKGFWVVDGVKIHGFDLRKPQKQFTAADFYNFAYQKIKAITQKRKLPIVVGGTGFYIKTLLDGINTVGIPASQKLRRKLEKLSTGDLYQKLLQLASSRAKNMNESDRQNPRRLIRAIEIALSNQESRAFSRGISSFDYLLIVLTAPNNFLYKHSDAWIEKRLKNGLIEEIKKLIREKVSYIWLENLGLEYRWITRYIKGQIPLNTAKVRLEGDTHNFIRRQKTWFNKFKVDSTAKKAKIFDISQTKSKNQLEKAINLWYSNS